MKNKTLITLKKDLRTTLRDKKSLSMMLIMPLIIPLLIFIFSYGFDNMQNQNEEVFIGITVPLNEAQEAIVNELGLNVKHISEDAIVEAYESRDVVAYVIVRDGVYHIYHNPNNQDSWVAAVNITGFLEAYSNYLGVTHLINEGIDPGSVFNLVNFELEELETNNTLVNTIIVMAFTFGIVSITTSAITSATDAVAGEKEKGTLETILTFPIASKQLITGKYLANAIVCLVTMVFCLILTLVSLHFAMNIFSIYEDMSIAINASTLLLCIAILVGYSLLIAGASIAIASYSSSFKEAQAKLQPLAFLPIIPMFLSMMGIDLTLLIAAIPGIGQAMLLEELFVGNVDAIYVLVMLVSNIIFLVFTLGFINKLYKSENILFSL